jgi:hypothetical protein
MWVEETDDVSESDSDSDSDSESGKTIFVTKTEKITKKTDIIGEFKCNNVDYDESDDCLKECINDINKLNENSIKYTSVEKVDEDGDKKFKILYNQYYEDYDTTIYGYKIFKYIGFIEFEIDMPDIKIKNNNFIELCDNEWEYYNEKYSSGYRIDVSNLQFKEGSLRNILMNLNDKNSIIEIRIHDDIDDINNSFDRTFVNKNNKNFKRIDVGDSDSGDKCECEIIVDLRNMCVKIIPKIKNKTIIESNGENGERIEDLFVDVVIDDEKDTSNTSSIGLKEYFSIFNLISMSKIKENINNDNNIKYYSTVDDNKYKIRVVEPDAIEVKDIYEAMPMKISQNNRSVVGTIKIRRKNNVDKIGLKIVNRYSGFYNPIFNDILYYDDYSYVKYVSELSYNVELPYSNTNIDYNYDDGYGKFGVIKNMYYHKTNVLKSNKILTSEIPVYPAINEYALGYRDYNVFSSNWDDGYFMSQDDLNNSSKCSGIGSMKEGLCMFVSKYLNIPNMMKVSF